jgi:MFS family permease
MKNRFAKIGKLWRTVLACALIVWLAYGLRFSTFNMLAVSITDDLGIARSAFTLSITFRYMTAFLLSLAFGRLIEKLGILTCLAVGLVTTAAGEYLFSAGSSLPVFYIAGAVSGVGYALASNPIAVLIVNRRFADHRGLIMGATSAVSGLGQALFNPVVGLLATRWGWRSVYLCSTGVALLCGLVIVFFLRADERYCRTADCGEEEAAGLDRQGMDMRQIVRSVRFWFLMLTGFLIGVAATGSYLIFPSHAQQDGQRRWRSWRRLESASAFPRRISCRRCGSRSSSAGRTARASWAILWRSSWPETRSRCPFQTCYLKKRPATPPRSLCTRSASA